MTTPAFANPVNGFIHDGAWVRPALSHEFKVTSTFAQHVASGRGGGIDIGNGHCGDPVLAMAGGVVSYSGYISAVDANGKPLPNPAKLVRIRHPQYPGYETGYLHLSSIMVPLNKVVVTGEQVGTHGMTGATACHLHGGCKFNGVEVDWWPYLIQNGATSGVDMTPVPVTAFNHLVNKKTSVVSTPTANFRADRYTTAAILKAFPTGTVFIPTCQATDGTSVAGSALWYGGFMLDDSPAGYGFGWFHASVVAPLADNLPLIEGATPAQVALAVKVATDPLNAKISAAMHDLA